MKSKLGTKTKSGDIMNVGEQEAIMNQPTPTELAQLAVALARTKDESVTPENRDNLLNDAYNLWNTAEQVIQTRQEARATSDFNSWSEPEIIAAFSDDPITFKEIVEKRLAKKATGPKGTENNAMGLKGIEQSLKVFFRETVQVPDLWLPNTRARLGSDEFSKAFKKQSPAASSKFLSRILGEKKISKALLQTWLAWRQQKK